MLAFIQAVDRWFFRILLIIGCLILATLAGVCFYQVFSRFVLQVPTIWSEALARTLMVWAVFLGTPVAVRRGSAITMNVLADMAPPRLRRVIDGVVTLAIAAVLVITLWQGLALLDRISNQRLAGLNVPIVWAYAAIPVGAALSLVALICNAIERAGQPPHAAFEGDTP
ncbi:TRAP transporter small permease [Acuticoccus kandeliae]|uniref:TRAP transporter small permease n=1 Tax=Acuticoccus kandeliae TaxID=2073160 RepID=UPI000D3E0B00|nr:TRAP transporter small permease [Acuticoccus kandeliae]